MNNLYGWVMNGYLPYGRFKWLKNIDKFDVNSVGEKSPGRYILKADPKYPNELHVLPNDYTLAPEKLSDYYKNIVDGCETTVGGVKKLIPSLGNKTNCVLHCGNLQLYLSLGMKLTVIHRVLKFKQSDWMKKYIDFNTEKRNPC